MARANVTAEWHSSRPATAGGDPQPRAVVISLVGMLLLVPLKAIIMNASADRRPHRAHRLGMN
jgi:hypothetical protein